MKRDAGVIVIALFAAWHAFMFLAGALLIAFVAHHRAVGMAWLIIGLIAARASSTIWKQDARAYRYLILWGITTPLGFAVLFLASVPQSSPELLAKATRAILFGSAVWAVFVFLMAKYLRNRVDFV